LRHFALAGRWTLWTDEKLYAKCGITPVEQKFFESMIKWGREGDGILTYDHN